MWPPRAIRRSGAECYPDERDGEEATERERRVGEYGHEFGEGGQQAVDPVHEAGELEHVDRRGASGIAPSPATGAVIQNPFSHD